MTMKNILLIFTFSFSLLASSVGQVNEEWIKMDVSIFQHFFKYFPLKPEITLNDLSNNLQRWESASHYPIGFDGILHWWILSGGTVTINSNIVSYNGQIIMAETEISQDYIKRLNRVFEYDRNIEKKFHEFFSLKVNPHYFNDSVYSNTYVNQAALNKFKNHVSEYLGKQDELDITQCKFEYDFLNNPTGRYGFEYFSDLTTNDWTPFYAIHKLKNENRIDCIRNIIKGYSLPGRIYGVVALLQLAKEGKYRLTADDKKRINRVLSLNLTVESGYGTDIISNRLYKDCVDADLIKILEK
jgi:hypothetical protein